MEIPSLVIVNLSRVDLDAVRLEALDATGAALARTGENIAQDAATPAVTIPYVSRQGTRPSIPVRGAPFSGRTRHTLEFAASGRDSTVAAPGSTGDGSVLGFNATAAVPRAMFTAEGHASHDAEIHLEHTEHVRVRLLRTVSDQRTVFTLIDQVDLADWMASLSDAAPLTTLTIPGTHDTCARTEGGPVTICQSMTLAQQLEAGVRFIDIRCRHVADRFQIYHGIISQDLEFGADVHDVCLEFLARHPRECIVMSIDEASTESDCTRTFEQTFRWYVEDDLASWSLGDTLPRLGDLRGKIVLFRRFERSSASQIGLAAEPWPDDVTFTIEQPVQMRVQDQYVVPTVCNISDKWNDVKAMLDEARDGYPDHLYVNFASGTSAGAYPPAVAKGTPGFTGVNTSLRAYLAASAPARCGVVLMDFPEYPDDALIALLVAQN